jgi:hypothetical protein
LGNTETEETADAFSFINFERKQMKKSQLIVVLGQHSPQARYPKNSQPHDCSAATPQHRISMDYRLPHR